MFSSNMKWSLNLNLYNRLSNLNLKSDFWIRYENLLFTFIYFQDIIKECHSANAGYLFQPDKHYDVSFDTGDKSVQCGRKVDVFKLWMLWKKEGDSGMENRIDHLFMLSR
jgi:hypothetical protein